MAFLQPSKAPENPLQRYRVLSPTAGVRVSPLCLGAMSIGDQWHEIMGSMDKASSFALLDAFFKAGGNFIDTANAYQGDSSEKFIGEWAEARGIRDQLVIATKYTSNNRSGHDMLQVNYVGNSTKSMHLSLRDSLERMRTTYVDIFYVHWWDFDTSIEEIMRSLHALVTAGKVLYLGASDMPAWVVSQANEFARQKGLTPFSVYQGRYSLLVRDMENDIFPMARTNGMAIAPYGVIGSGKFITDAEEERREKTGENGRKMRADWKRNAKERAISQTLERVSVKIDLDGNGKHPSLTAVALAHCMLKTPYVFPIIGGRKVEHLNDNIVALDIINKGLLTAELTAELEAEAPVTAVFPNTMIGDGSSKEKQCIFLYTGGFHDRVSPAKAIGFSS